MKNSENIGDLTHSQLQIAVGQRLNPGEPLYNMAFAFLIEGELDPERFRAAWGRVVAASDALSSRILDLAGGGFGRATAGAEASPPVSTLDFRDRDDSRNEFLAWSQRRCRSPLPLSGDLLDCVLVRLGEQLTGWYLNQHHVITDAWSTRKLFERVSAEYRTEATARSASKPSYYEVASQYQQPSEATSAHWAKRQRGGERKLDLYGSTSSRGPGTASRRLSLQLDADRTAALQHLAAEPGFSSLSVDLSRFALFATLLSAWLSRVSGHGDVGFDTPVAGRRSAIAKETLGLFIEMFPFAVSVPAGATFRTLGGDCLAEAMALVGHGQPGLSRPSASDSRNVVLNYVPIAFGDFAGFPTEVEWLHPGAGDSVHALRLQVHDFSDSGHYRLDFDVNESLLPEPFGSRVPQHFEALLDAMLEDPDQAPEAVDLRTEEERQNLERLNDTWRRPTPSQTVVEAFEATASAEPDRVALRLIVEGEVEESITFAELRSQVQALAGYLVTDCGLTPGDCVAIPATRSIETVTAILSVLRARCAYVPIDPAYPEKRRASLFEDSGAVLNLDGEVLREGLASNDGSEVLAKPELGDLAYLLYTSGSTGRPKGVLIEHGGLSDYLEWAERHYVRGGCFTYALTTSLSFDLTVTCLYLPLITGGTLEIYPRGDGPIDRSLLDVVDRNAVDFVKLTPSHLSLLRRRDLSGSRIRRLIVGGESFPSQLASEISSQLDSTAEIYNEYGPTEAVVGCVVHRYDPADAREPVPIGAPADHVTVEVLNSAATPVPEGVPGELWISRYGLARGYHRLEELTSDRFRTATERPARRRYRTGDLVRHRDSSTLEFLGRIDRQLKVAGFRVEPGEIESILNSVPGIDQSVVVTRKGSRPTVTGVLSKGVLEADDLAHCIRCVLPSNYPGAVFDQTGLCSVCRSYESIRDHAAAYFRSLDDLREIFAESSGQPGQRYDCMMLYSGGKDSTYALCRLVELGYSVYAFTLDNGFISEGAKRNISGITEHLGVEVEFATTPAMNAIFRDSLVRFSNVCNGCFKTIYTLAMQRARELEIPIIVTGLSRGQMFETRLTEDMFRNGRVSPEEVDTAVLASRKAYHRTEDEVSRSLDVSLFRDDRIFEEIRFVDFYRYCDVDMEELYSYLRRTVPWVRPEDTGRSTNCLINDAGIFVHQRERGFHNYALPYSWDVRLGHKQREAALEELDDDIDESRVREILDEVGYSEGGGEAPGALEAFYTVLEKPGPEASKIRERLTQHLPSALLPSTLHEVEVFPLTEHGKVDVDELVASVSVSGPSRSSSDHRPPSGPVEEYLAELWQDELAVERVGRDDEFFELGGTSLTAMRVMLRLCEEFEIDVPLETVFSHPSLHALARVAEDVILADADL